FRCYTAMFASCCPAPCACRVAVVDKVPAGVPGCWRPDAALRPPQPQSPGGPSAAARRAPPETVLTTPSATVTRRSRTDHQPPNCAGTYLVLPAVRLMLL